MAGFVADSREITATKVDDAFTFSGRMPPNPGESQWHIFKIQTTPPDIRMRRRPWWTPPGEHREPAAGGV
jgi:hypothetical protein